MLTDVEIANQNQMKLIKEIAQKVNITEDNLILYGNYKAKINVDNLKLDNKKDGKLILVTAISPTPAGEGKTTTSVGLADSLQAIGKKTMLALREPSLGPVFGLKGGAAGGGYAQVVPMEDINLHFTGDFHAITSAHNLLSALIDNHIFQGNELNIDPRRIVFKKVLDMNDRQLRQITTGLGGALSGVPREDGFDITVASEIMAILCLANDLTDLKEKLGNILVAYTYHNEPVYAKQLQAQEAMTILLKDAIFPNLVQTLEHTPTLIHGGPFANIAHGCNSIVATKTALKLADYVVTEAGFGSDLGAEKFINIKCRKANIAPNAVVIVATIRALKMHGGLSKDQLNVANTSALLKGIANLKQHLQSFLSIYHVPVVVAINQFNTDTKQEIELLIKECKQLNVDVVLSEVFSKGSKGGITLAEKVIELIDSNQKQGIDFVYEEQDSIEDKILSVVQKIYGGKTVQYSAKAMKSVEKIKQLGFSHLPICMAKTPYSFSDDNKKIGAPKDFTITVSDIKVNAGAGFIVVLTGAILTMPGLPKKPVALQMTIDKNRKITGLF